MDEVVAVAESWAARQDDVRAVGLVGSYARGTADADSDLDLIIVVDHVGSRLSSREWLSYFGKIVDIEHEDWGLVQSLRVRYQDGREIEFGLAPIDWCSSPVDPGTAAVIRDGLRVLFDPEGLLATVLETVPRLDKPWAETQPVASQHWSGRNVRDGRLWNGLGARLPCRPRTWGPL